MSGDLISRAKAIAMHNAECSGECDCCKYITKDLECGILHNVPAVDAVEVVRCKDCAHARALPEDRKPYFADDIMVCALGRGDPNKGQSVVWPDDFCSDGVRMDKEEE